MKNLLLTTIITLMLAFSIQAQTNLPPVPPTGAMETNIVGTIGVNDFLGQVWNTMVGQGLTNLSATVYVTDTVKLNKWGYGLVVLRNLNIGGGFGAGIGVGLDQYDNQWFGLNAQASIKASTTPFAGWGTWGKKIVVTPFGGIALGTPFGESSTGTAGNLETIEFVGANVMLFKALGANWGIDGIYGTRTGLADATGQFYGGGITASWKF